MSPAVGLGSERPCLLQVCSLLHGYHKGCELLTFRFLFQLLAAPCHAVPATVDSSPLELWSQIMPPSHAP